MAQLTSACMPNGIDLCILCVQSMSSMNPTVSYVRLLLIQSAPSHRPPRQVGLYTRSTQVTSDLHNGEATGPWN